jgi:hypothetical protein
LFNNYVIENELTPKKVAEGALIDLAKHSMVQTDFVWRHIALLPIFDESTGTLQSMRPIFIDLTRVNPVENVQVAEETMRSSLSRICHECSAESSK